MRYVKCINCGPVSFAVTYQENYTKLMRPLPINLYIINIDLTVLHQLAKSVVINPAGPSFNSKINLKFVGPRRFRPFFCPFWQDPLGQL